METYYRSLFEKSSEGIMHLSLNANIVQINESFAKMHGYTIEEMKDIKLQELDIEDLSQIVPERVHRIINGEELRFEVKHRHKKGHIIILDVLAFGMKFDNDINIVTLHRDITEQKHIEELLLQKNIELQKMNASKDKFFSIIAHDLRNPFQTLMGFSSLLLHDLESFSRQEIKDSLQIIYDSSSQTYKLLESLLEWAKIQTNRIQFKPELMDLKTIILDSIIFTQNQAVKKDIQIFHSMYENYPIFCDKNMISTILRNIITNGIKFTHRKGNIFIHVSIIDNYYEISIKDTGIGISKKDQESLFQIDTNIKNKGTEGENGTGIGLILCKEFVEKHGGQICVKSEIGNGTEFIFSLPQFRLGKEISL